MHRDTFELDVRCIYGTQVIVYQICNKCTRKTLIITGVYDRAHITGSVLQP